VRVVDLTPSNPTSAGLLYDTEAILGAFRDGYVRYAPHPRGDEVARAGIAAYYAALGCAVSPGQIHLTSSSSEAYAWLFKLLADPGDAVLSPRPAYPLFRDLAALEGVSLHPYAMKYHPGGGWRLDRTSLDAALTGRTRAVLAVHPANPTGGYLAPDDLRYLLDFCALHGLAFIVDEVFYDYSFRAASANLPLCAAEGHLCTFVLNGFSKMLGLPQMKLGWIVSLGENGLMDEARDRLDYIADTYLSVSGAVQAAAPRLLVTRARIQEQIRDRCVANLAQLRRRLSGSAALTLLPPEGGWSAVIRLERGRDEEVALALLRDRHVLVHPGAFFDFAFGDYLVVSLLTDPGVFDEGVMRLLEVAGDVENRLL
jgi:aspartate/methionine/tyrosine aminotransferase